MFCRCLGKLSNWSNCLGAQSKLGYNAIHFVPMQEYGASGSMFSVRNQHSLDNWYIEDPNMPPEDRMTLLENTIKEIVDKHGLLCFVDVVLNHTSKDSLWLEEHPDAAFNLQNCPFLKVAWEFDKFLIQFSEQFAAKKIQECKCAPYISSENDWQSVKIALIRRAEGLKLETYFLYNIDSIKVMFDTFMETVDTIDLKEYKADSVNILDYTLKYSFGYGENPRGVKVISSIII